MSFDVMFSLLCCVLAPSATGLHADHHGFLTRSTSTYPPSSDTCRTSWSSSRSLNNTGCATHIDSVLQHKLVVPTTNVYRRDVSRPRSWCMKRSGGFDFDMLADGAAGRTPSRKACGTSFGFTKAEAEGE